MTQTVPSSADGRFTPQVRVLGALVAALGSLGLAGWLLDVPLLRSILPSMGSMKPNTGLALVCLGCAIWAETAHRLELARPLALSSLTIGVVTLFEHLTSIDLGVDTLLIPSAIQVAPGAARLSFNAALCLTLGGLGSVLARSPNTLARGVVQLCGMVITAIGFVGVASYLFSVTSLRGTAGYGTMALHTAVAFLFLGAAQLLRSAEHGVLRPLTQDSPAGAAARRLLPWLLLAPSTLGWVRLVGQREGWYGTEFGLALMVGSSTAVLTALALWNAHLQGRDDRERLQTQRDERIVLELSELFRTATDRADLLTQVSARLLERFRCTRAFFILANEEKNEATILGDARAPGLASIASTSSLEQYPKAYIEAARRNETFVSADLRTDPRYETAYRPVGITSRLAVPIARQGHWVGGVTLSDSAPREWTPREVVLVREVAERAWLWLERLDAMETLQRRERTLDETVRARTETLQEREVLLQEIHHRVKNNLQIVSSLINMQARQLTDVTAQAALRDCKARVEAIALVHEQLYQATDYARVPFDEYARSLANNVFNAGGTSNVKLELKLAAVPLSMDQAIPCGLLLNELMSNAMKHAFPQGRAGTITIELSEREGQVRLRVQDDGVGLKSTDLSRASLGTQLINALVRQLSGALETTSEPGATFEVTFRTATPRERSDNVQTVGTTT